MDKDFTSERYKKAILSYLKNDYTFENMDQHSSEIKNIALVHDVDHDISLCDTLLSIEREMKVTATYFLRLHAINYNMLSRKSLAMVEKIIDAGCNIALHYEPSFCPTGLEYLDHIEMEMDVLSTVINKKVKYFNLHEPSRTGVNLSQVNPVSNRCYNSSHFEDYKYLSDSSCNWREGCFSKHVNKWNKLLVLTHPIWWYKDCPSENY